MGVEHVIGFPNLFTYYEQNMVKSIIFFDTTTMYIKDGMKDGRVWQLLKEGIMNSSKEL